MTKFLKSCRNMCTNNFQGDIAFNNCMFYREGYVRFCANSFTMKNMHESIHLSNVSLQMKYQKVRRPNVPEECIWDYKEFQNHLA